MESTLRFGAEGGCGAACGIQSLITSGRAAIGLEGEGKMSEPNKGI